MSGPAGRELEQAEKAFPAGMPVETTIDAFWGGRFHLVQPKGGGFRSGLDTLLLAASIPRDRRGLAADLGSGAGGLGLAVAARCANLFLTLAENQPHMAALARRSLALPSNAQLAPRLRVVDVDVVAKRAGREEAGLHDGGFSTVVTNPPFHPPTGRASPDVLRQAALTLPDADLLPAWIISSSALLEHGGLLAMIARPDSLPVLLEAARNRLGDIRVLPVHARPDDPAIRILLHARRGSKAGLSLMPPIVLHAPDGALTALGHAIGTGEASIDLDL